MTTTVHVLYENPDWNPPLIAGLEASGFDVQLHFVNDGIVDPATPPAEGMWLNRVSPSSHTREHENTVPLAREVLFWLAHHGRRVINGLDAFELEMSKLRQDLVLRRHGLRTPKTVLAVGTDRLLEAARTFDGPFITKHNQGGKGLGIELFHSAEQLAAYVNSGAFDPGPDGKVVLQQYIQSPNDFITRVEIVGDQFLFAMRSRTDEGFQLCPSDACQVPASSPDVCPADPATASKFSRSPLTAEDPLVQKLIAMCLAEGIEVAGIEFIEDADGDRYVYDINGTTNYSGVLAEQTGIHGMHELGRYLRSVAEEAA